MADAALTIHLVFFPEAGPRWARSLRMPPGSRLEAAVRASGFQQDFPAFELEQWGVGVYGKLQPLDYLLQDNDRVEIYQPLRFDPMESRRRRAQHKAQGPKKARSVKVSVRS